MADKVSSIEEVRARMGEVFDQDKAVGVDAIFQFDLSGDNGGQFWISVEDSSYDTGSGVHNDPTLTITATADDYLRMVNGELTPMSAFMAGKIKIKGDMGLALKLQSIFPTG